MQYGEAINQFGFIYVTAQKQGQEEYKVHVGDDFDASSHASVQHNWQKQDESIDYRARNSRWCKDSHRVAANPK